MDRSLDEIISERPQRGGGGGGGRRSDRRAPPRGPRRDERRDEGPRDGVRKNRQDDRANIDGDWVHDRYEEDRGGRRRGGYQDDEIYDRRAPPRRAPDDDICRVRVENLHYDLTEEDIAELFMRIGPIVSARLHYDRSDRSTGTAIVIYEDPRDARDAVREFNGANANGQPIRLSLQESRRGAAAAEGGSLFDRIQKPSRSMFERIDSSDDVNPPRRRGGRRDDRSFSPRKGLRVPEGVDRYEPGGRDSRSPLPGGGRRGGGRERGGRRPGARREESGRAGGRGKREDGRSGPRPKKTAEELDAEMEDYFGGNGGGAAGAENNGTTQQNGGGAAPAAPAAPAATGDDDIDMIE